jgi:hypothetical protein
VAIRTSAQSRRSCGEYYSREIIAIETPQLLETRALNRELREIYAQSKGRGINLLRRNVAEI